MQNYTCLYVTYNLNGLPQLQKSFATPKYRPFSPVTVQRPGTQLKLLVAGSIAYKLAYNSDPATEIFIRVLYAYKESKDYLYVVYVLIMHLGYSQ